MTKDYLIKQLAVAASSVKLCCGVANNMAIVVMLDAMDEISGVGTDRKGNPKQPHPNYRQGCKRQYKRAIEEWRAYERRLLHTQTNRFFCVADMTEDSRKIYDNNLTDEQYFDFWKGMGDYAYSHLRPLVTSLQNKYRLSLVNHHIQCPEPLAWTMTAMALLALADKVFTAVKDSAVKDFAIPRDIVESVFASFSLRRVASAWRKAVAMTDDTSYELESLERKNIDNGLVQIMEAMTSTDIIYGSCIHAIPEYAEIFRSNSEMKRALKQIKGVKHDAEEQLKAS